MPTILAESGGTRMLGNEIRALMKLTPGESRSGPKNFMMPLRVYSQHFEIRLDFVEEEFMRPLG